MKTEQRVRRLRRKLLKSGYLLHKARGRDDYMIITYRSNLALLNSDYTWTLDDVEEIAKDLCRREA